MRLRLAVASWLFCNGPDKPVVPGIKKPATTPRRTATLQRCDGRTSMDVFGTTAPAASTQHWQDTKIEDAIGKTILFIK